MRASLPLYAFSVDTEQLFLKAKADLEGKGKEKKFTAKTPITGSPVVINLPLNSYLDFRKILSLKRKNFETIMPKGTNKGIT